MENDRRVPKVVVESARPSSDGPSKPLPNSDLGASNAGKAGAPPNTGIPFMGIPNDLANVDIADVETISPQRATIPTAKFGSPPITIPPPSLAEGKMLGGAIAPSALKRAQAAGSLLGEILVMSDVISPEICNKALSIQEERGGQLGRILVSLGACSEPAIARALVEQIKLRSRSRTEDVSLAARANPEVAGLRVLTRPALTSFVLLACDLVSLSLAALVGALVDRYWSTFWHPDEVKVVGPTILLSVLVFLFLELYSPLAKSTPDELRMISLSSVGIHIAVGVFATPRILADGHWGLLARGVWLIATCAMVPFVRAMVRAKLAERPWWGIPVLVLGAAKTGRLVVRTLKAQPRNGMKPVALLDDDAGKHGTLKASFANETVDLRSISLAATNFMSESTRRALADELFGPADKSDSITLDGERDAILDPESSRFILRRDSEKLVSANFPRGRFAEVEGIPVVGDLALAPVLARRLKIPYAVLAMPGVDSHRLLALTESVGGTFSHLLVIPDLFGFATLGVPAKSIGGILGVEVRQQLLLPWPRLLKRVIDTVLTSVGGILILPFLLLIGVAIKLDSAGPIFYMQKRLGRDGDHFMAKKFRTMHGNGEDRLKQVLDSDPALRAEYELYHKLRKDPRVTRVGRILRKFSFDEFPQLWNVIVGEMSLVGPRPYIERELPDMGGQEKIILRATPGMTGMWQVSDRHTATFAWRVQVDVHYVRNWSPWLDMYILAKTVGVVLRGSGV